MSKTKRILVLHNDKEENNDTSDEELDEEENDNKHIPHKTIRIAKVENKKYGSKCVICDVKFVRTNEFKRHITGKNHRIQERKFIDSVLNGEEMTAKEASKIINSLKDEISKLKDKLCRMHEINTRASSKISRKTKK